MGKAISGKGLGGAMKLDWRQIAIALIDRLMGTMAKRVDNLW
jgi:hypothetical protein